MVKPQAKIRPLPKDEVDDGGFFEEGHSIDSMNTVIAVDTHETSSLQPDFIIVYVSPKEKRDVPLICIEVKLSGSEDMELTYRNQLSKYVLGLVSRYPHHSFVGILILGTHFYKYTANRQRVPSSGGEGWSTAKNLREILEKVAREALKTIKEEEVESVSNVGNSGGDFDIESVVIALAAEEREFAEVHIHLIISLNRNMDLTHH